MTIKISEVIEDQDQSWMNADQSKVGEGVSLSILMSAEELEPIEQIYTQDAFLKDLKKVSRRIKK